jgi:hypothetical protein
MYSLELFQAINLSAYPSSNIRKYPTILLISFATAATKLGSHDILVVTIQGRVT